jgi:hypothetical protein
MILPLIMVLVGVFLMIGDALFAKKRVLDYCRNAGLEVKSLQFTFARRHGPFSPYRGKHIFRGVLKGAGLAEEFPAWFSSAGLIPATSDEPLEVIFSR